MPCTPSRPGGFLPICIRQLEYILSDSDWDAGWQGGIRYLQVGIRYLCLGLSHRIVCHVNHPVREGIFLSALVKLNTTMVIGIGMRICKLTLGAFVIGIEL